METQKRPISPPLRRALGIAGSVLLALLLILGCASFFSAWWYLRTYGYTGFDSVLFTLTGGLNGVSGELVKSYLTEALFPAVAFAFLIYVFLFFPADKVLLQITCKGKKLPLFPLPRVVAGVLTGVIALSLATSAAVQVGLPEYVIARSQISDLY